MCSSQGANFTAGGRDLLASRSREADDSVLVKTERKRKPQLLSTAARFHFILHPFSTPTTAPPSGTAAAHRYRESSELGGREIDGQARQGEGAGKIMSQQAEPPQLRAQVFISTAQRLNWFSRRLNTTPRILLLWTLASNLRVTGLPTSTSVSPATGRGLCASGPRRSRADVRRPCLSRLHQ
jgi:hypothetical protein